MILDRLFESRALSANDPALKALIADWSSDTLTGMNITPATSLKISGWYAGVRILAETIASLPIMTYRRTGDRGKERAPRHPVYKLLHDAPNPFMTAFEFIETSEAHLVTWGNAFASIERNGAGQVTALWPLGPDRVRIQIYNGRIWYYWRDTNGQETQIPQDNILHLRGLGADGLVGYSPVDLMRSALGLTKIEEEYRLRFFKNDAKPGAVVEYPGKMSDPAYERFKKDWEEKYSGLGNKFRVAFLEQGLKWHDVGFPPETTQFIEGRKFQLEEIARILGIPLILLQSTEKATSWGTGIEQFLIAFMRFTIRPWLKRWEARLNTMMFSDVERANYFSEFLVDDLLRADSITRAQTLQIWRRNGIINADEWRSLENMNPLPSGQGEKYIIEGNMTTLDQVGEPDISSNPALDGASRPNGALNGNGAAN